MEIFADINEKALWTTVIHDSLLQAFFSVKNNLEAFAPIRR